MSEQPRQELSELGMARREAILRTLLSAQARRVSRRRAARAVAAGAAVVALVIAGWAAFTPGVAPPAGPPITRLDRPPTAAGTPSHERVMGMIQIVSNDPAVTARYTARGDPGLAQVIDDRELDAWLVRAGRTPGMIRVPGRLILAAEVPAPRPPGPGRG